MIELDVVIHGLKNVSSYFFTTMVIEGVDVGGVGGMWGELYKLEDNKLMSWTLSRTARHLIQCTSLFTSQCHTGTWIIYIIFSKQITIL